MALVRQRVHHRIPVWRDRRAMRLTTPSLLQTEHQHHKRPNIEDSVECSPVQRDAWIPAVRGCADDGHLLRVHMEANGQGSNGRVPMWRDRRAMWHPCLTIL